jgi:2-amino-4-hydroxy-6-hydroxymethyldihydropteridine diphosphokinase
MRNHPSATAYIALGSNLGNREANIRAALSMLERGEAVAVRKVSALLENPSVGGPPDAPAFLNAVAEVQSDLGSHALLHRMLEIERDLGRKRRLPAEPRTIDLDLLLYENQIISSQELVVPHPLMHERRFVLEPLAEIAPHAVHPVLQMTAAGLLDALNRQQTPTKVAR